MKRPEDFGAGGAGHTNDTVAVQSALTCGELVEMSGRYKVRKAAAGAWCLSGVSGLRAFGAGQIVVADGQPAQTSILRLVDIQDVVIAGIKLDGNATGQRLQSGDADLNDPKKRGFDIRGSSKIILDGVRTVGIDGDAVYNGKSAGADPFAHHITIRDLVVENCRRSGVGITNGAHHVTVLGAHIDGWSGNQSAAVNIEADTDPSPGCHFERIHVGDPAPEAPHTCYSFSITQGNGVVIRDCEVPSAIFIVSTDDPVVDSCTIVHPGTANAGSNGIHCRTTVRRPAFRNNHITMLATPAGESANSDNFHTAAIYVANTNNTIPQDATIEDNYLNTFGLYGVNAINLGGHTSVRRNLVDCNGLGTAGMLFQTPNLSFDDLSILENTIRNAASYGIDFYSSANDVLDGNGNITTQRGFRRVTYKGNRFIETGGASSMIAMHRFRQLGTSRFTRVDGLGQDGGNMWSRHG